MEDEKVQLIKEDEQTLSCKFCKRPLMHYWRRAKVDDEKCVRTIFATCPFCDGQSDKVTINGFFMVGPIGEDEDSCQRTAIIESVEVENGIDKFIIVKRS